MVMKTVFLTVALMMSLFVNAQKSNIEKPSTSNSQDIGCEINVPNYTISESVSPDCEEPKLSVNTANNVRLKMYPNPVHNEVMVLCDESIELIEILNLHGQTVFRSSGSYPLLSLNYLPEGLYLMVVSTDSGKKLIEKFVRK